MIEEDPDLHRSSQLIMMLNKLNSVIGRDAIMRKKLTEATLEPSAHNVEQLSKIMQSNRIDIANVMPSVELFEQQSAFVDDPERPLPEVILSPKVGLFQHAILQQMQRIDASQHQPVRYQTFNRQLSKKIEQINNTIEVCLENAKLRM